LARYLFALEHPHPFYL